MSLPLSVFIIACNEAGRIARTISSVADLTGDIIVVDSGSTDGTQEIARRLGAKVIHHPWAGYGRQKRFAEQQCRYAWRLNLDADEVVSPTLRSEILQLFKESLSVAAYSIRIVDVMPGHQKPAPFAYAHINVRLYHRDAGQFSESPVHDVVVVNKGLRVRPLKQAIYHYSLKTLGAELSKINEYTDALVCDLEQRGIRIPIWRVFIELPLAFFKAYFLRRHFMLGTYGYLTAMSYAFSRHLRVAKYYEQRHVETRAQTTAYVRDELS